VVASASAIIFGTWWRKRRARLHARNRTSVLATTDARHALRDPHPSTSGSMRSNPVGSPEAGSLRGPDARQQTAMGSMNERITPASSAADLRTKEYSSSRPPTAQKSSSRLQRKPSGGTPKPRSPL
jgi:hypothetical protein